jgi:hypothetical protein
MSPAKHAIEGHTLPCRMRVLDVYMAAHTCQRAGAPEENGASLNPEGDGGGGCADGNYVLQLSSGVWTSAEDSGSPRPGILHLAQGDSQPLTARVPDAHHSQAAEWMMLSSRRQSYREPHHGRPQHNASRPDRHDSRARRTPCHGRLRAIAPLALVFRARPGNGHGHATGASDAYLTETPLGKLDVARGYIRALSVLARDGQAWTGMDSTGRHGQAGEASQGPDTGLCRAEPTSTAASSCKLPCAHPSAYLPLDSASCSLRRVHYVRPRRRTASVGRRGR